MDMNESLLRAIFATVARSTFSPKDVYRIITPYGGSNKQVTAYNLRDGKTPQVEIARKAKLDNGTLSGAMAKWVEAGIVVRIGEEQLPLHIYPLSAETLKQEKER
ncbi:hypothetical protein ACVW1C_005231 [Bradyrhizobium sp. USDA 4011]